jgi:2'-5' RNA ligase
MPFALDLFFDPKCEARIRRLSRGLRETQIGGTVVIEDVKARPHITLSVCDAVDETIMCAVIEQMAMKIAALPVSLSSLGMFPGDETVLFLAPSADAELIAVQAELHARLTEFTHTPWKLYAPGRWVPHCTLAMRLGREGVLKALDILMESTFPITGELVEIGVSEFADGVVKRYLCMHGLQ